MLHPIIISLNEDSVCGEGAPGRGGTGGSSTRAAWRHRVRLGIDSARLRATVYQIKTVQPSSPEPPCMHPCKHHAVRIWRVPTLIDTYPVPAHEDDSADCAHVILLGCRVHMCCWGTRAKSTCMFDPHSVHLAQRHLCITPPLLARDDAPATFVQATADLRHRSYLLIPRYFS